MQAMSEHNGLMSANNSWISASDYLRGKNLADISGAYKNFLENDIDFNEQLDFGFKMPQRDIFGSDLSYETSELMLSNSGLISNSSEPTNSRKNALKLLQINGNEFSRCQENSVKYFSTRDDTRMEEVEEFQRAPSKRIMNDFDRVDFGIGWSNDRTQYAKALYQLNQSEIGNGGGRGYYPDDDDIHNMLATDSSLTSTPLSNKPMVGGLSRKFICEPDDEIYHQNSTLKLLRSNFKFEPKWPEFQLEPATFPLPHHDAAHLNDSSASKSTQLNDSSNNGNNFLVEQPLQQAQPQSTTNVPRVYNKTNKVSTQQRVPSDMIRNLVHLDLEEFCTGKNSCYPKLFTVPKQLQLLIENDPEGYLQELNLPTEVADAVRASKILKRLKFRSRHKIGTLTPEERNQKLQNFRQKRRNKNANTKAHSEARKKLADNQVRQNSKTASKNKAKKETQAKANTI